MKYLKYVFGLFLVLFTITLFVPSVDAQEVPTGVNSVYREVSFWEYETYSSPQLLVKSNRFYISDFYDYFLFDLKGFVGSNLGGALGGSQGIYFYSSSTSTTPTNTIKFNALNFDNFIDMTSYNGRWIEFRLTLTVGPGQTYSEVLYNIQNNSNYMLSVLAISGNGLISEDSLYNYITNYVDTFVSGRVDSAYQNGYDSARNEYGYNYNGIIITGDNAYSTGYQKGIEESGQLKTSIINFIPGVLGSIFMFFFQIGQIGILGITILDILGILVLISGLIFIIKFFF